MPKESLKDKIEGNELDLSLSSLTTLPIKELAVLTKATRLDLSCNQLTVLPDAFSTLVHLVKLDLSKNGLTVLPERFGALQKLQHLDLYKNKLHHLPIGFCHLKALRWLDVKGNPLDETLKSIAGDCLDDTQCRTCAKQVVLYMKTLQSEHDRQSNKALQEKRAREAAIKDEEEQERREKKALKKLERERRKQDQEAVKLAKEKENEELLAKEKPLDAHDTTANGFQMMPDLRKSESGLSGRGVFLTSLMGLVAIFIGLYFYCDAHRSDPACAMGRERILHYYNTAKQILLQSQ